MSIFPYIFITLVVICGSALFLHSSLYIFAKQLITMSLIEILFLFPFFMCIITLRYICIITSRIIFRHFGRRAYIFFAAVGVTIHELSHWIFALLFGHKIIKIKIFDPNSQTLGSLHHSYNTKSWFQTSGNFFIGLAPFIIGSSLLVGVTGLLAGFIHIPSTPVLTYRHIVSLTSFTDVIAFMKDIAHVARWSINTLFRIQNLLNPAFYIYTLLLIAIGSQMSPSLSDFRGALYGVTVMTCAVIIGNTLFVSFYKVPSLPYSSFVIYNRVVNTVINAVVINCFAAGAVLLGAIVKRILMC